MSTRLSAEELDDKRIEAAAKVLFERDLKKDAARTGFYSNLRPYYEADARRVLAAAEKVESRESVRLREALRAVEWEAEIFTDYDASEEGCAMCKQTKADGHKDDCIVARALLESES